MTGHRLFVLFEWDQRGEALIGPLAAGDAAGYEVTFRTPTGRKPTPLGSSTTPGFVVPPLGKAVTSPAMAEKPRRIDESSRLTSRGLDPNRFRLGLVPVPPLTRTAR